MKNRYTVKEVSELLGVTPMTVWRWVTGGKIKGFQMVEGGRWFIAEGPLKEHFAKMGLPWEADSDNQ